MSPTAKNKSGHSEPSRATPEHAFGQQKQQTSPFDFEQRIAAPDFRKSASDKYAERCEIDRIFALDGFAASPSWDIMLRFYIEDANSRPIRGPNIGIGNARAASTCARWLRVLVNMGLIEQLEATQHRDEGLYCLAPDGRAKIEAVMKLAM